MFFYTFMDTYYLARLFPAFEHALLEELVAKGTVQHFKEGERLMRTGQYFRSTLLITEGLVKIYREDGEGAEFFIYYLQPGQGCALSMFCNMRQEASSIMAVAARDTTAVVVATQHMEQWMTKYITWVQFVLGNYRSRFEELLQTVDHVAFKAMDERLELYLKTLRDTLHTDLIETSHQQIAGDLNSSREVISRLLKKLEQLGKVKLHRNAIEIMGL